VELLHPELNDRLTFPGFPMKVTGFNYQLQRRAPFLGEHNEDIYQGELGLTRQELVLLKTQGVI